MNLAPLFVALVLAAPVSAATRRLSVRVAHGKSVWAKTWVVTEDSQFSFTGPISGKKIIINALAASDPTRPGLLDLQYQLELSGGSEPTLQAQGAALLRPGTAVESVSCGPWTVELGINSKGALAGEGFGAGDGNVRFTAELLRDDVKTRCRQVLKGGAQGNVVDSRKHKGRRIGFTMNSLVEPSVMGVKAEYQIQHTPPGGKRVQIQSDETLAYGRKKTRSGPGYRLELMAEGDGSSGAGVEED